MRLFSAVDGFTVVSRVVKVTNPIYGILSMFNY